VDVVRKNTCGCDVLLKILIIVKPIVQKTFKIFNFLNHKKQKRENNTIYHILYDYLQSYFVCFLTTKIL